MSAEVPPGLIELLKALQESSLTIPDEVTQHILRKTGCDITDVRTVRMVSLAGQEFIANIVADALKEHNNRRKATLTVQKAEGLNVKDRRPVLLTEDLAKALQQYGINARRPEYFLDKKAPAQQQQQQ